jgi:hypothetical protein
MGFARELLLVFLLIGGSACAGFAQDTRAQAAAEDVVSQIVGTWRGNSVCTVKDSPCHDEVNVYRFSKLAGRPGSFTGTASKVVDGREIVMGSGEWTYDSEKRVLECKAPAIRLVMTENKMEGSLTSANGTVYRRVYLKKEG